jgi:hypothetical protein
LIDVSRHNRFDRRIQHNRIHDGSQQYVVTESLLDQETAGQPVAFIGVQRVRFLFLIRAR